MTLSDDATWILIGMKRAGAPHGGKDMRKGVRKLPVFIVAVVLPIVAVAVAAFVFINK